MCWWMPYRGVDAEEATRLVLEEQLPAVLQARERDEVSREAVGRVAGQGT